MKKIVVNLSDLHVEKLRFEAMEEKKDLQQVIKDRIFFKEFSPTVEEAFNDFMEDSVKNLLKD